MARYLDPKNGFVFYKIFGEHPHLLKNFLNALLPLPENGQIETLEYLSSQQIPKISILTYTVVNVKCTDQQGQIFIVEMQIEWTDLFTERLLFDHAQVYVKHSPSEEECSLLIPVYGLSLINCIFDKESSEWYHHYGSVKLKNHQEQIIKGLTLVFVEIPKFISTALPEMRLKVLWLRFMKEISHMTREIDPELFDIPEIKEAIALAEESSYSPSELDAYETYWKAVSSERTLLSERTSKAKAEGFAKGYVLAIAEAMKKEKIPLESIANFTGLDESAINSL